jgi:hypothetical protein
MSTAHDGADHTQANRRAYFDEWIVHKRVQHAHERFDVAAQHTHCRLARATEHAFHTTQTERRNLTTQTDAQSIHVTHAVGSVAHDTNQISGQTEGNAFRFLKRQTFLLATNAKK